MNAYLSGDLRELQHEPPIEGYMSKFPTLIEMDTLPKQSDAERYFDRLKIFKDTLKAGVMPPLGNGFSFVIDVRPAGQESEAIPSLEYTAYFMNGQIPIAEAGHKYRPHDEFHGPNYQTLLEDEQFAQLVRGAATKAYDHPDSCKVFTAAIDQFSDAMSSLERDSRLKIDGDNDTNQLYMVTVAENKLKDLIELNDPLGYPEDKAELLAELHNHSGLLNTSSVRRSGKVRMKFVGKLV